MQFFSNHPGNVSHPQNSYEYEDDFYDDGSLHSHSNPYQSSDANAYGEPDHQHRSYYKNSQDKSYPANGNLSPARKVASITETKNRVAEVLVLEPTSFEEMPYVIQALRAYKSVVLNLSAMNLDCTQRAIDFITGGTFAIDGNYERIGEGVFLFTPGCVQVKNQAKSG